MQVWMYFTPFLAAGLGWWAVSVAIRLLFHPLHPKNIAGITIQGLVPKRQHEMAVIIGRLSAEMLPVKELEEKITHPDNVKKIMPQAEEHIDHFLRVKLVKSMPVVGMFVGDKTINNLKSLFITELEHLFPEIMKNYIGRLQEDFNIEQLVTTKIAAIPPSLIENAFLVTMKKELRKIKLAGAILCFIVACLQCVFLLALNW